jgi:hypothetical protein
VIALLAAAAVALVAGGTVAVLTHRHNDGQVAVTAPVTRSPTPRPTATPTVTEPPRSLVATARWFREARGFQLRVRPSLAGRRSADQAPARALAEALTAARPTPLTVTPSVRRSLTNQLRCHADFAPRKPTWDLETWRPDVGYVQTVLDLCNP